MAYENIFKFDFVCLLKSHFPYCCYNQKIKTEWLTKDVCSEGYLNFLQLTKLGKVWLLTSLSVKMF